MVLWKCCTQYATKFGKLSSGHRTGKGQFSFQSQRKTMPKNAQPTTQLHSSHMLAKWCSKFSKPGFNRMWTLELPDVQAGFRRCRGTKWPTLLDHRKSKRCSEKHLLLLYLLHQSLWIACSPIYDWGIRTHHCLKKKKKPKVMASGHIISWQIEGEKVEAVTDIIFLGSKISVDCDCSHEI